MLSWAKRLFQRSILNGLAERSDQSLKAFLRILANCLSIIILLSILPALLLTITAFLGSWDWRLDLTSHFRPWYFLMEAVATVLFLILGRKRLALMTALFLMLNASQLWPLYIMPHNVSQSFQTHFKLMQFNVCAPAKDYSRFNRYITQEKPDMIVMEECGENCNANLNQAQVWKQYPYQFKKIPRRHRLVVVSKFPLRIDSTPKLHADPAVALLTLSLPSQPIQLFVMHSTRPSSGAPYYKNQIAQFKAIGQLASQSRLPFLMAGDLNVSPWNYSFGLLLHDSHLKNTMDGFGFQPSFPTFVPHVEKAPIFPVIPIDQVLVSKEFSVLNRHTGPRLQSDHLPVIVELGL